MLNPDVTQTRPGSNERLPDVRDIVDYADRIGQLARIDGADWNIEIGVLAEIFAHSNPGRSPAVLFDRIKDYPPGMRIVSGLHNSCRRVAFSFGFPDSDDPTTIVKAYRDRMKNNFQLIPPVAVTSGPILENVDRDDAVDLFKFPVPMIHEKDGGRYIGTYCVVIMQDPDTGWVNLGTYRTVAHDKQNAGVWISPGKHGRLIREKYFKQGKPCPVLICCGLDPVLFLAGSHEIKHGTTEYAYAGGHRGRPYETIASELYGLPMPANAEIVLEGEFRHDETRAEGPFGEFTGYYASHVRDEPVVRVRRVYHRNDPILTMASPMRPPTDVSFAKCIVQSGMIWDEIESAGLVRREGRVVPRSRRHPHVHGGVDRADASRPRPAGRHAGRGLPLRQLRRTLGGRGRQRHRPDQSRRRDLGDVDALRSRGRHRIHQARVVDAARSDAARAAVGEYPRHRERLPAVGRGATNSRRWRPRVPSAARRPRRSGRTRSRRRPGGGSAVFRSSPRKRGPRSHKGRMASCSW